MAKKCQETWDKARKYNFEKGSEGLRVNFWH